VLFRRHAQRTRTLGELEHSGSIAACQCLVHPGYLVRATVRLGTGRLPARGSSAVWVLLSLKLLSEGPTLAPKSPAGRPRDPGRIAQFVTSGQNWERGNLQWNPQCSRIRFRPNPETAPDSRRRFPAKSGKGPGNGNWGFKFRGLGPPAETARPGAAAVTVCTAAPFGARASCVLPTPPAAGLERFNHDRASCHLSGDSGTHTTRKGRGMEKPQGLRPTTSKSCTRARRSMPNALLQYYY
jgi:hypothetical protein